MKVTYIHHSSFLAELENSYLLFDYYQGTIPKLDPRKHLYVFASHAHGDHFAPVIFDLEKEAVRETFFRTESGENPRITYILSRDIGPRRVPADVTSPVIFLKSRETWQENDIRVETFRSTDAGVAWWIRCEGKEIYHAGDLNNWWWEGEDKAWNHNMAANYHREIEKMHGRHADAAFVPLDPRQEKQYSLGMDELMAQITADAIFPMHFWGNYDIIKKMKQDPVSAPYRDRIVEIHREGEEFEL